MGCSGDLDIFDADAIDAAGLRAKFFAAINSCYERVFLGKRVYTAYRDDRSNGIDYWDDAYRGPKDIFKSYLLATWEVWT